MPNLQIGFEALNLTTPILHNWLRDNLYKKYGDKWFKNGVTSYIRDSSSINKIKDINDVDIALATYLIADIHWNNLFEPYYSGELRTRFRALKHFRNKHAHNGSVDMERDEVFEGLVNISFILEVIASDKVQEIEHLKNSLEETINFNDPKDKYNSTFANKKIRMDTNLDREFSNLPGYEEIIWHIRSFASCSSRSILGINGIVNVKGSNKAWDYLKSQFPDHGDQQREKIAIFMRSHMEIYHDVKYEGENHIEIGSELYKSISKT
ncbi:Swt1 family HEPN domain-containing protein [Salimicrobium halophilum]|nr:Swt1 family HEPN domain-containing protein [Salimicrobium halophilum]